ncbi:MAG: plasmid pRiA4b ORF-3 family protein, partial [Anaerolineae bacterium]
MAEQESGNDAPDEATIYQVRLDLKGVRPPVWRRLLLYSDTRLDELHELIQVAMGWTDSHLHMFNSAGRDIGDVATAEWEIDCLDERDFYLSDVLAKVGDKLQYEYDFGDSWQHILKLEKILPVDSEAEYPACMGGKRACPLEDVGGFP